MMNDHPCFEQLKLFGRKLSLENLAIKRHDNLFTGIFRMNMRHIMRLANFPVHADDDSMEKR